MAVQVTPRLFLLLKATTAAQDLMVNHMAAPRHLQEGAGVVQVVSVPLEQLQQGEQAAQGRHLQFQVPL
jgi:hypothetical protein